MKPIAAISSAHGVAFLIIAATVFYGITAVLFFTGLPLIVSYPLMFSLIHPVLCAATCEAIVRQRRQPAVEPILSVLRRAAGGLYRARLTLFIQPLQMSLLWLLVPVAVSAGHPAVTVACGCAGLLVALQMARLCLSVPVAVVEHAGFFGAIRRSAHLTRGVRRLPRLVIFGLLLLYLVIHVSASLLVLPVVAGPLFLIWWVGVVLQLFLGLVAPLLAAVLTAEIYFYLLKNEGSAFGQTPVAPEKYKKA